MINLWCYIEGERHLFNVSISPDRTIHNLKKEIHKQGRSSLFVGCDPIQLTLTRVCYIMISM